VNSGILHDLGTVVRDKYLITGYSAC